MVCPSSAILRTRLAVLRSAINRSTTSLLTSWGEIWRSLAQRANRDRPSRMRRSWAIFNSDAQLSLSSTVDVFSIGRNPEPPIAAARSLRRLAHRLRDTFAWIGTIRSRTERMAVRSSET